MLILTILLILTKIIDNYDFLLLESVIRHKKIIEFKKLKM